MSPQPMALPGPRRRVRTHPPLRRRSGLQHPRKLTTQAAVSMLFASTAAIWPEQCCPCTFEAALSGCSALQAKHEKGSCRRTHHPPGLLTGQEADPGNQALTCRPLRAPHAGLHMQDLHECGHLSVCVPQRALGGLHLAHMLSISGAGHMTVRCANVWHQCAHAGAPLAHCFTRPCARTCEAATVCAWCKYAQSTAS